VNGKISPEMDRVVGQPTFSLNGEGRNILTVNGKVNNCPRDSYPRHAVNGLRRNTGGPDDFCWMRIETNKLTQSKEESTVVRKSY
jgi:hypothetical protein